MGQKRIVDLSISIEPKLPSDPPMMIPQIDYITHEMGAEQMKDFYPGLEKNQLPGGLGWASHRALDAYWNEKPRLDEVRERGMSEDLSWARSAQTYDRMLRRATIREKRRVLEIA